MGGRRGVDPEDLQTGNAEAGKHYFNGAGNARRAIRRQATWRVSRSAIEGLKLEERFLYPHDAPAEVTVTLVSGRERNRRLAYRDEFTIGLRDSAGRYRSWAANQVKYSIEAPAEAHADLLAKYTDDDIHNLMAYLQTLQ